jgi:hypothetical protein
VNVRIILHNWKKGVEREREGFEWILLAFVGTIMKPWTSLTKGTSASTSFVFRVKE